MHSSKHQKGHNVFGPGQLESCETRYVFGPRSVGTTREGEGGKRVTKGGKRVRKGRRNREKVGESGKR